MAIEGVDPPVLGDTGYIAKINNSLYAIDNHDHAEDGVARIANETIGTDQLQDSSVSEESILDNAVTSDKLSASVKQLALYDIIQSESLDDTTQSLSYVEVFKTGTSDSGPLELNGMLAGDIIEIDLVRGNNSFPALFGCLGIHTTDTATPILGSFVLRDQDNTDHAFGVIGISQQIMDGDPQSFIPCGSCSFIYTIPSDGNYSFRLFQKVDYPGVPAFTTIGAYGVKLYCKIYREIE